MGLRFTIYDLRLKCSKLHGAAAHHAVIENEDSRISARRRGFSFTEVMFAVIILGIGFIMVAGIFPVSLQQARLTSEETTGAVVARAGLNSIKDLFTNAGTNTALPATGLVPEVRPLTVLTTQTWDAVRGNAIYSSDPRFAWMLAYRRMGDPNNPQTWAPSAQVFIFPVYNRNEIGQFTIDDTRKQISNSQTPNLVPKFIEIQIANDVPEAAGVDIIGIAPYTGPYTAPNAIDAAAEGAYVVISNDRMDGRLNGRIYRLGALRQDLLGYFPSFAAASIYELQPGNDFQPDPGPDEILGNADDINGIVDGPAFALVVGRGYANPLVSTEFAGTSMALGAYVSFLKVAK